MEEIIIEKEYRGRVLKFLTRTETGLDDTVSDNIVIKEMFDENVYDIHDSIFKEGSGNVLDIGANIGAFSIQSAVLGAKKVFAFEPEPENYRILCENIKMNGFEGVIIPVQLGIFDGKSHKFSPGQGASHIKSLKTVTNEVSVKIEKTPEINIKTVTLEDAIRGTKVDSFDVLKCDIEGSEHYLFATAKEEDLKKVNYIAVEMHIEKCEIFGQTICSLLRTHNVHAFGSYTTGGQLFGRRY